MKRYFDNLNGIRFLLAFTVIILHTAVYKNKLGLSNYLNAYPAIYIAGEIAVSLFFTLSGFLISYYLILEKQSNNHIKINSFYIKRIFRIWPLYFFAILLYWFVIPELNFGYVLDNLPSHSIKGLTVFSNNISNNIALALYVLFMPQVAVMFSGLSNSNLFPAAHLWSIGVEELFYLFIPIFLLKTTKIFKSLMRVTIAYYLLPIFLLVVYKFIKSKILVSVLMFISINSFCSMLLGCLVAYLYINHKQKLLKYCNVFTAITALVLFALMLIYQIFFYWFVREIYSFLFCIMLVYAIENKSILLENRIVSYLGKISFGIYIYHNLAIGIILHLVIQHNIPNDLLIYKILITFFVLLLTIVIAAISYELFEKKILNIKFKFNA